MSNLNLDHLFDPGDDSSELDAELTAAGTLLEKWAQEEGVDLNALPDEEVAGLFTQMVPSLDRPQSQPETTKESNMSDELTAQDVHFELTKVANAEGVDLNQLDRDTYTEAFNSMLEEMQSPDWAEKVAAEEEAMAKLAEAEVIGQAMGDAFLTKLAEAGVIDAEEMGKEASKTEAVKNFAKRVGAKIRHAEQTASTGVGRALRGGREGEFARVQKAGGGAFTKPKHTAKVLGEDIAASRSTGRKALAGGAAALGTAGAAGAALGGRKKQSFDEAFEADAIAYTNHLLVENEKISADEVSIEFSEFAKFAGDEYFEALDERAADLLREAGWIQ